MKPTPVLPHSVYIIRRRCPSQRLRASCCGAARSPPVARDLRPGGFEPRYYPAAAPTRAVLDDVSFPGYLISPAPNGGPANAGNAPIDCEVLSRLGNSLIRPSGSPNRCSGASWGPRWKDLPGLSSKGRTAPHRSDRHRSDLRRTGPSGRTQAGLGSAGQSPWAERRRTELDVTDRPGQTNTGLIPTGLTTTGRTRSGLTYIGLTHVGLAQKGLTAQDGQTQA